MELPPELIDHILVHLDNLYIAIALERNDSVIRKIFKNNNIKHLTSNDLLCVKWIYQNQNIYNSHNFGFSIIFDAFEKGNLEIIKFLYKINPLYYVRDFEFLLYLVYKNNNKHILEWLHNNTNTKLTCDSRELEYICNNGYKDLLYFVCKNKLTKSCILKSVFDSYDNYKMDIFNWCIEGNIIEENLICKKNCIYKNLHDIFMDLTN